VEAQEHFNSALPPAPLPDYHVGRSWNGPGPCEENCPCEKAPCGLVSSKNIDPACPQHSLKACKTMRCSHLAEQCPGEAGEAA
jgi:hypothetical protein